ncbi:hypothetical protein [Nitratifractor sp.]
MEKVRVAFATHAFHRDWDVVMDPRRLEGIIRSHQYPFEHRLLVVNNLYGHQRSAVEKAASRLLAEKVVTEVIWAEEYLTEERLESFGLHANGYWSQNPYFSSAQLAALSYLHDKSEFVLHMAGDVWLQQCGEWIERALEGVKKYPQMLGFNLTRNIYLKEYPRWADFEDENFWIVSGDLKNRGNLQKKRFCLSDLAYLIRTDPNVSYNFSISETQMVRYGKMWPEYARPCFEMMFRAHCERTGALYGALKPDSKGIPMTKHKNFSSKKWKRFVYKKFGVYYPNGKYASQY